MSISGVSNNSYVNNYYQNKTGSSKRETVQEDVQQEPIIEKEKTETTQPTVTNPTYRNSIMVNGLYVNIDPTSEVARKAYFEERARQIEESTCKVQSYYAKEHEETMSFDNPFNHLLEKYNSKVYKLFKSPYFRSDMTEAERKMAFEQECAMLEGRGFYDLNDPYAWASSGGVPDRQKQLDDAVQAALDKRRKERLEEVGGESTYEDYFSKSMTEFTARYSNIDQSEKMGQINFQA